jgi:hypothetical protein
MPGCRVVVIVWSRSVDENGTWLQTVDNHRNFAGSLNNAKRADLTGATIETGSTKRS